MSHTGGWSVGAVSDADVVALPLRFAGLDENWTVPPGCAEDLRWWLGGGDREPYFTPEPTAAAHRFAAFARSGGPTAPAVAAMKDAATDLLRQAAADGGTEPDALFTVAVRGGEPATALHHGLGAEASARLPGWFGDFLLTADEVRAVLPDAESVLAVSGPRRTEVLARTEAWAYGMTGAAEGEFDAAGLLAGPLRVLRYAAAHGRGVVAVTDRY